MLKFFLPLFLLAGFADGVLAQPATFHIQLEPVTIPDLKGIQSYAFAQADGKWLIIGGRIDGLHRRMPFGAFTASGRNTVLTVIDPVKLQKWETTLAPLNIDLRDQLSSTNMQFHQQGRYLYLIGGYGYCDGLNKFVTYNRLSAIDVPNTINAIVNNTSVEQYIRQITDTSFAVAGGHLKKINDTYYLMGGQKFMGRYNPMGPDHGPGFIQEYTNQVRTFTITDDGAQIKISNYKTITDAAVFHRRDYNAVPQIMPDGQEGVTMFSGVFQPTVNIPFLNSATISGDGYAVENSFAQYYNHYHSAVLPMFDENRQEMHNVFFGGIAQYYDSLGILVQNDEVPFVKTIARVTRDKDGRLAEYKMPVDMPDLLGAGSEFIPLPDVPHYANEVIKLNRLVNGPTLVGYIFGGIASSLPNIFFINNGEESNASHRLFRVYIIKGPGIAPDVLNGQSNNGLQLQVFPDFDEDYFLLNYTLAENTNVEIEIRNGKEKILRKEVLKKQQKGTYSIKRSVKSIEAGDVFWIRIKTAFSESTQKIIVEP
ncbi:MAG: T9SS C-terminal target domain-containing protein [Chitinophagaceae bacterium]|nr:T9SS C-terminal target domain-containing protein [Chitinophagaceae bacterium]